MNRNMNDAKRNKNDEFYTRLEDIENELKHYKHHFKGKTVYCNADDPRVSNFFRYFSLNFEHLGLRKLITTCYKSTNIETIGTADEEKAVALVYEGAKKNGLVPDIEDIGIIQLRGNGDFRSKECRRFLEESDIVVTNPPFSLFREYVGQLMRHDKRFIIMGNMNAITYKEIFPLIKDNRLWLGHNNSGHEFILGGDAPIRSGQRTDGNGIRYQQFGNTCWYTNLEHDKRNEEIILYRKYSPEDYPRYDNYDAIEVGKVKDIPKDYDGIMGVPISYLDKHDSDRFEIVGTSEVAGYREDILDPTSGTVAVLLNGNPKFKRIFIKRKV